MASAKQKLGRLLESVRGLYHSKDDSPSLSSLWESLAKNNHLHVDLDPKTGWQPAAPKPRHVSVLVIGNHGSTELVKNCLDVQGDISDSSRKFVVASTSSSSVEHAHLWGGAPWEAILSPIGYTVAKTSDVQSLDNAALFWMVKAPQLSGVGIYVSEQSNVIKALVETGAQGRAKVADRLKDMSSDANGVISETLLAGTDKKHRHASFAHMIVMFAQRNRKKTVFMHASTGAMVQ
jgi:hypothetical protein